jgi:cell wall-associated NlpC family hydrolase
MLAGCASTPPLASIPTEANPIDDNIQVPADAAMAAIQPEPQPEISTAIIEDPVPIEDLVRSEVLQWQGTPYRMGGSNRNGIDCSGFVQRLYRDLFDRQLPRSTALQSRSGQWIGKDQLRTGDLVFFSMPYQGRHVGIYLGEMEFAHASITQGVTISSLEEVYWRQSYWTARRYLDARH